MAFGRHDYLLTYESDSKHSDPVARCPRVLRGLVRVPRRLGKRRLSSSGRYPCH